MARASFLALHTPSNDIAAPLAARATPLSTQLTDSRTDKERKMQGIKQLDNQTHASQSHNSHPTLSTVEQTSLNFQGIL